MSSLDLADGVGWDLLGMRFLGMRLSLWEYIIGGDGVGCGNFTEEDEDEDEYGAVDDRSEGEDEGSILMS